MIIFERLLIIYLLYLIAIILHELAHYIVAKILKVKVESLTIGEKFFAIKIGKLSFSPLAISGYVEYDENDLKKKSKFQIIFFFLAGALINAVLIIVALFLINISNYAIYMVIINAVCIITSLLPIRFLNNDFVEMYKHIHK